MAAESRPAGAPRYRDGTSHLPGDLVELPPFQAGQPRRYRVAWFTAADSVWTLVLSPEPGSPVVRPTPAVACTLVERWVDRERATPTSA